MAQTAPNHDRACRVARVGLSHGIESHLSSLHLLERQPIKNSPIPWIAPHILVKPNPVEVRIHPPRKSEPHASLELHSIVSTSLRITLTAL